MNISQNLPQNKGQLVNTRSYNNNYKLKLYTVVATLLLSSSLQLIIVTLFRALQYNSNAHQSLTIVRLPRALLH